ncbi:MAG: LysR family transcriptional regulator [Eubacteriales bacterium]|nr:LysR family transcriptional regulator [Eubacteriales bacterium]
MDKINAEVFMKIVETGSFRKAAAELEYTQAGIGYIVHAMESEIGLSLFVREHNGVHLSPEGEALLPHFQQLLAWERGFDQHVKELKGLESGTLRVQIFDSISIHWIPGIVKKFHEDFPGISIELVSEEDSRKAEEMVLNGEVDCGFFLTEVHSELEVFRLMEEKLMAIVPLDHPLADKEYFPIKQIGKYPYISMKYDDNTGINRIFTRKGLKPQTAFYMDNDYAAMAMVSKGLGYCIFPELLLRDIPYDVKCMEFDEPQTRIVSVGTRSMDTCSKACRKFVEYTREWVLENRKQ